MGRLGGEEFGILLPVTDLSAAISVAERVRREIAALKVPYRGAEITLTVSIGASEVEAGALSLESTSDRADTALYLAKAGGRNRVNVSAAPPPAIPIPVARRLEAAPARASGTLPAWS